MNDFNFSSPSTLEDATSLLAEKGGRVIAGGTDIIPQMLTRRFCADWLIDLSKIRELRYITHSNDWVELGAMTTYAQIVESKEIQAAAPLLAQAASLVGSMQIRHRGTIGGNIGNASPAGDTLPPLLALNAEVVLVSSRGNRSLPLSEILIGPGKTALSQDEIIQAIRFRALKPPAKSIFLKLGSREGMAISIVSVAMVIQTDAKGTIEDVRISLGAVAPTAIRCYDAERLLMGQKLTMDIIEEASNLAVRSCSPITDIRGTAEYRRHAVKVLVKRGLRSFLS